MPEIIERLPRLLEMENEDLPYLLENAADKIKDKDGSASMAVANSLRFLAVANYVIGDKIILFKEHLSRSAEIRQRLIERFESGEPISRSYVSMISYKSVFNALAAGNMMIAAKLSALMGGRTAIENEFDHRFDIILGYTLKYFLSDDKNMMHHWARKLDVICRKKDHVDFLGYAQLFNGIYMNDLEKANQGIKLLIDGHKRQIRGRGVFKDSEDELLCIWGIGMVNLAHSHNLEVDFNSSLIPKDLTTRVNS